MLAIWYHVFALIYTCVYLYTAIKNTSIYIAASEISSSTRLYKFATQSTVWSSQPDESFSQSSFGPTFGETLTIQQVGVSQKTELTERVW